MTTQDTCCTLVPYFQIHDGQLDHFKKLCNDFMDRTRNEPDCLYYGFSFNGNLVHCREGYTNADAILHHLENVAALMDQALDIADIARLEVHGPSDQIDQLRQPLSHLSPQFFTLECGFRRIPAEQTEPA